VAIGGVGFGYQEFRKAEARSVCDRIEYGSDKKAVLSFANAEKTEDCLAALESVPFKTAEVKSRIKQGNRMMPLFYSIGAIADGFREAQQQTASSSPQPVATSTAVLASAPSTTVAVVPSFDSLPPCNQLDSVAKSGKPVSEFLVAAARVNDLAKYQVAIGSVCPWNAEQLQVADRVLNPPVVVVKPQVVWQPSSSSGGSSSGSNTMVIREPAPSSGWNNCNGVQESGESYSARCETAQEMNDAGVGNSWSGRVDNRPKMIDPGFGGYPNGTREGQSNGYSNQ
jgi:hypothetical protein